MIACVQTSSLHRKKWGEETSVNRRRYSYTGIHLPKLTVEKMLTDQHNSGPLCSMYAVIRCSQPL